MKRLIVALVASVAVSAAFAKLTYTQGFEGESYDPSTEFTPSVSSATPVKHFAAALM